MLIRSGSLTKPSPLEEFDCGSQSTNKVFTSAAAREAARLMAVVVFPTPPFWLATAMTRPMIVFYVLRARILEHAAESNARLWCNSDQCSTWNTIHMRVRSVSRVKSWVRTFHMEHWCAIFG